MKELTITILFMFILQFCAAGIGLLLKKITKDEDDFFVGYCLTFVAVATILFLMYITRR